jgi:NAD(P)-dependent dehydrogenase (short-subunit alcohol dehydrogenase family)
MGVEAFRFDGKRALVVGGATGMGAAAAQILLDLGAEVIVMDIAEIDQPGAKAIGVDLRDRASIDAAVDDCGGPVHAVLACAGVADGTAGIERTNFIGHRHLIDRLLAGDHLVAGSAIGMISSVAGLGWESQLTELGEYLDTPDFDSAVAWIDAHPDKANYSWAKQAMCAYVAREAHPLLTRGIRINAIMPGPTDTPLARANADTWLTFGQDYRESAHLAASTPAEQAYPLIFLCSPAASHVSGVTMITDAGYVSSGLTGSFDAPAIRMMLGLG